MARLLFYALFFLLARSARMGGREAEPQRLRVRVCVRASLPFSVALPRMLPVPPPCLIFQHRKHISCVSCEAAVIIDTHTHAILCHDEIAHRIQGKSGRAKPAGL